MQQQSWENYNIVSKSEKLQRSAGIEGAVLLRLQKYFSRETWLQLQATVYYVLYNSSTLVPTTSSTGFVALRLD